jgi:hypothetical protein
LGQCVEVERIIELAKEVEAGDPIDWGMLSIDEDTAYRMLASFVIEQFDKYDPGEREIMIATIVKLVVENFMLNLKLQGK